MKTAIFILILTVITSSAFCKTITVTSSADNGAGTLRQAIADADSASIDKIVFEDSVSSITLISQIDIEKSINIIGDSSSSTILIMNGNGTTGLRHMKIATSTEVSLYNLTLRDNHIDCDGGAIVNSGTLTLYNCRFLNNRANNTSGAIYSVGKLNVYNCTFDNNNSSIVGGAIHCTKTTYIEGCTFTGNHAYNGGAISAAYKTIVKDCLFQNNSATFSGAIGTSGDMLIEGCYFKNNSATTVAAVRNSTKLVIINSVFEANSGGESGGVVSNNHLINDSTYMTIYNCLFFDNIMNRSFADQPLLGNYRNGSLSMVNSTIINNTAIPIIDKGTNTSIYNNIMINNTSSRSGDEYDLYIDGASISIDCSNNIIGNTNSLMLDSSNIINVDPLFNDISNNDFSLQALSPAVDAGNNSFYSYANYPKDLVGDYRIDNATIDIGAHEYQSGNPPVSIKKSNNDKLKIYTMDKNIVIANTTKPVFIYNLQGICVAQGLGNVFTVPSSGIYIVLAENQTQKVMVK